MKFLIFLLLFGSTSYARTPAKTCDPAAIIGGWYLDHIIYQGEPRPPFNPDLEMTFDYWADGVSHLFWFRNNEVGFCERKAAYTYENCQLKETITWVNPGNAVECDYDPDMQLGRTTTTKAEIDDEGYLRLYLPLGDEELVLVLLLVDPFEEQEPDIFR